MSATVLANMAAIATFDALSVAMTDIARALNLGATEELWLPDAFLLAVVCATPLTAYLIRRFGVGATLTLCLVGTAVASALSSLTESVPLLLSLLFVQGLVTAPIPPSTQALIAGAFPPERRNVGMAVWSGGTMVGILLGSFFGGYVSSHFGWRWIFLICIPPAIAAIPLVRAAARRYAADGGDKPTRHTRPDGLGMILLVATLLAATIATNLIADLAHERIALIAGLLLIAAITGTFFAINYRRTDDPILDLGTLRDRPLAIAALLNLVVAFFSLWAPGTAVFDAAWPGVLSSIGYGILATALAVVAFATVRPSSRPAAASVFVFCAVFGSAVGVAALDATRTIIERSLVDGGAAASAASLSSYIAIMWIQLVATIVVLPLPFLLNRTGRGETKGTTTA